MERIDDLAKQRLEKYKNLEQNLKLVGFDPMIERGFTQVPNLILQHPNLSIGAKATYALMLSYAWQKDYCFPGQATLANDLGSGERSVRRYIKELEEAGYIKIKQRGLGKVNLYELHARIRKRK
jgi:biotin operon repressor